VYPKPSGHLLSLSLSDGFDFGGAQQIELIPIGASDQKVGTA